jgi:IclR family KDG regulon transcriptional repressor
MFFIMNTEAKYILDSRYHNQTVWRTLAVLQLLTGTDRGLSLSELGKALDCSKSSLFPILKTMEESGFIASTGSGVSYRLTPKVYELVRRHSSQQSMVGVFEALSKQSVSDLCETMQMAVLDGTDVVYIAKQESNHPVRLVSEVGRRLPGHATALGKCLLSGLSDPEIEELYEQVVFESFTSKTIADVSGLVESVQQVRSRGYAEDWQEISEGLCCIGAPVRDGFGITVAAVSFAVPLHRVTPEHWYNLKDEIVRAATMISNELGYSETQDPTLDAKVAAL